MPEVQKNITEQLKVMEKKWCDKMVMCIYIHTHTRAVIKIYLFIALNHLTFFSSKSGAIRRSLLLYFRNCFVSNIWHQVMYGLLKLKKCL